MDLRRFTAIIDLENDNVLYIYAATKGWQGKLEKTFVSEIPETYLGRWFTLK